MWDCVLEIYLVSQVIKPEPLSHGRYQIIKSPKELLKAYDTSPSRIIVGKGLNHSTFSVYTVNQITFQTDQQSQEMDMELVSGDIEQNLY